MIHEIAPLTLERMTRDVMDVNTKNGWHDGTRAFAEDIALLHSEVSEALEAYREHGVVDITGDACTPLHAAASVNEIDHTCKPEGVGSELADVLIRLLDTCGRYGIDLEREYLRKLAYNKTRGYRHGGKRL